MRQAHCADVANQEFPLSGELFAKRGIRSVSCWREEMGLHAVFDDSNFFSWDAPALHQVVFECRSHDDDEVGALIEKLRHSSQTAVQHRIFGANTDRG